MALSMNYFGDRERAKEFNGLAMMLLYKLEDRKKRGKLKQIWDEQTFSDGTVIRMESIYDKQTVWITSPFIQPIKEEIIMPTPKSKFVMTYTLEDDTTSPYPCYLWSTRNGKELKEIPDTPTLKTYNYREGAKSALTKDGWFSVVLTSTEELNLLRSYNYGNTFEPITIPVVTEDSAYFDLQADSDGWLWLVVNEHTSDKNPDGDYYGIIKLYVSKNKGNSFELVTTITGSIDGPVSLSNIVRGSGGKTCYIGCVYTYNKLLKVYKFEYKTKSSSVIYTFNANDYRLDSTMALAANDNTWALLFAREREEEPYTGYTEPVIVRNGTIVWEGVPYTDGIWGHDVEAERMKCEGETFVATFTSLATDTTMAPELIYSTDDAQTFSRKTIFTQEGFRWDNISQNLDIKNGKILYAMNMNINLSSNTTVKLFTGGVEEDFELIYEKTFDAIINYSKPGDARIFSYSEIEEPK